MSFNRENVTWQSEDGTWNMAFFRVAWVGEDPEWDVEYDFDRFQSDNYAKGQSDPDTAYQVATRRTSNPGGTWVISHAMNPEQCKRYSGMLETATAKATFRDRSAS